MAKSDWCDDDMDWEDRALQDGWCPPDEFEQKCRDLRREIRAELEEDLKAEAFSAVAAEFERLIDLDQIPRRLGEQIVRVVQNEARYGR